LSSERRLKTDSFWKMGISAVKLKAPHVVLSNEECKLFGAYFYLFYRDAKTILVIRTWLLDFQLKIAMPFTKTLGKFLSLKAKCAY
jgi:hypothetical protein